MRCALILLLALASCAKPPPETGPTLGTYAGTGRDRLCIARLGDGLRAGIATYGEGISNCTAGGGLARAGDGWQLVPRGEGGCKIAFARVGETLTVSNVPGACSYYCAPGATLVAKRFTRDAKASPATDFAGDPLC